MQNSSTANVNLASFNQEQINFLTIFQRMSSLQRKLWQLLCWFQKTCLNTKVRQEWLAHKIGCCRATVNAAVKKFRDQGWLGTFYTAYSSLEYFIDNKFLMLDTRDKRIFSNCATFKRENLTQQFTHNKINSYSNGTLSMMEPEDKKPFEKRERSWTYVNKPIPYCLQINILSDDDKQKLANQFFESELQVAIKETIDYWKNVRKPTNIAAFLTSRAKEYRNKYRYK